MRLAIVTTFAVLMTVGCKGHPPPHDTDKELFRTPEALTVARELNVSKWIADYLREKRHLPASMSELRPAGAGAEPADDPLKKAFGDIVQFNDVSDRVIGAFAMRAEHAAPAAGVVERAQVVFDRRFADPLGG